MCAQNVMYMLLGCLRCYIGCEWMVYEMGLSVMHLLLSWAKAQHSLAARLVEQEIRSFCLHSDLSLDPVKQICGVFDFLYDSFKSVRGHSYFSSLWFQSLYKAIVYPCMYVCKILCWLVNWNWVKSHVQILRV